MLAGTKRQPSLWVAKFERFGRIGQRLLLPMPSGNRWLNSAVFGSEMHHLGIPHRNAALALDQFVTGHPQCDTVLGHVRDLIGHDIAVGGKEAGAIDPHKAVA
jgi:hypothetical protein